MNPFTCQMFNNHSIAGHFITRRMAREKKGEEIFSLKLNKGERESQESWGVCAVGMRLGETPQVMLSAFLYIYTITRACRAQCGLTLFK